MKKEVNNFFLLLAFDSCLEHLKMPKLFHLDMALVQLLLRMRFLRNLELPAISISSGLAELNMLVTLTSLLELNLVQKKYFLTVFSLSFYFLVFFFFLGWCNSFSVCKKYSDTYSRDSDSSMWRSSTIHLWWGSFDIETSHRSSKNESWTDYFCWLLRLRKIFAKKFVFICEKTLLHLSCHCIISWNVF